METACDFQVIEKKQVTIGDAKKVWKEKFSTIGIAHQEQAILTFMVSHLTGRPRNDVPIFINDQDVGVIHRYDRWGPRRDEDGEIDYDGQGNPKVELHIGEAYNSHWFTQSVIIDAGILHDGENEIRIQAVQTAGSGEDKFDDFYIKSIICSFKKACTGDIQKQIY